METAADGLVRSLLEDEPMLADLVRDFVVGLPGRMEAFAAALDAADLTLVARLAHKLKGAAGSYGFPGLSTMAVRAEQAARSADVAAARAAVDVLAAACAVAVAATGG